MRVITAGLVVAVASAQVCNVRECGCAPYKQAWCTARNAKVDSSLCQISPQFCSNLCGEGARRGLLRSTASCTLGGRRAVPQRVGSTRTSHHPLTTLSSPHASLDSLVRSNAAAGTDAAIASARAEGFP